MPEDMGYRVLTEFPDHAEEQNINVRVWRINAYAGYLHTLYQRLLKPDGSWDDDISGLLSQIRS